MKNLVINGKNYEMPTEKTTIETIKKVVASIAKARNLARKDVRITLPTGRIIAFSELNMFKDMVIERHAGTYAGKDVDDNCAAAVRQLDMLTEKAFQTPLDFSQLGSRKVEDFVEIAQNTETRLLAENTITEEDIKLLN